MKISIGDVEQRIERRFAVFPHRGVDKVIGDEVKSAGTCDLSQREIGRRASVSYRTVDRRLKQLEEAGMITIMERTGALGQSITNSVSITSRTWREVLGLN